MGRKRTAETVALTEARIASIVARGVEGETYDSVVPGLVLRVHAGGRGALTLKYTRPGAGTTRIKLGDAGAVAIGDARKIARQMLGRVASGGDPVREREDRREAERRRAAQGTVREAWDQFLALEGPRMRPITVRKWRAVFDKDVAPSFGRRNVAEVTRRDIVHLIDKVARRSRASAAKVQMIVSRLFAHLTDRETIPANPASRIKRARVKTGDEVRTYSDEELRAIFRAARGDLRDLLLLCLLTGVRKHEAESARVEDVDLDGKLWAIPAPMTKTGTAAAIPLSEPALALMRRRVESAGSGWVFRSRLPATCLVCGQGHRIGWASALGEASTASGVRVRAHNLRRTAASLMTSRVGVSSEVVSRGVLRHKLPGVDSVYILDPVHRASLADAMDRWGAEVARILAA